ncbi:MAG: DUF192 domain-containing protein [Candidatus Omnitrophica bacterium]|nr:DUF192 domain-containing protein [Candidatus Omnitrophota bacterium]
MRLFRTFDAAGIRAFVLVLLPAVLGVSCAAGPFESVCFKTSCIQVERVDTPELRARGLMFRDSLGKDEGMLFVFDEEAIYGFWMKNMKIPLDMIWLDGNKRVVDIKTRVPACSTVPCPSYIPRSPALYVLEVNAGFVDSHRIRIGDTARF